MAKLISSCGIELDDRKDFADGRALTGSNHPSGGRPAEPPAAAVDVLGQMPEAELMTYPAPVPSSSSDIEALQVDNAGQYFWDRLIHPHEESARAGFPSGAVQASEPGMPSQQVPAGLRPMDNKFSSDSEHRQLSQQKEIATDARLSLPRARTNVEAVMGLFAAFVIGIPAPIVVTSCVIHLPVQSPELLAVLSTVTFVMTAYLCLTVVRIGGRAVEGDRPGNSFSLTIERSAKPLDRRDNDEFFIPLALAMAIRLPNWWTSVRPFIAIWWLCHFVVAALIGHLAARQLNGINNPGLITIPITLAVTMAFLFAANLYLMLAIAVSIRLPQVWLIAWRYRFVVDLVVTIAMIASG